MKKNICNYIYIVFLFSTLTGISQVKQKLQITQTPKNLKVIGQVEGDLDKDGFSEKVIVYDTDNETDMGTERQIYIYKSINDKWVIWKKSVGAVLPSVHGGIIGDPFQGISIERGCIVINHFGGSSSKWRYTHRYRYQNGSFYLIGASTNFGSPCENFITFDYNLSTGLIIYKEIIENCGDNSSKIEQKNISRKLKILPEMDGFYPGNNELKFPNYEITIYY